MNTCTIFKRTQNLKHFLSTKVLGVLCLLLLLLSAQAHSANNRGESGEFRKLTEQESWILGQIRQGNEADLKKRVAGGKENYSVDAGFLKQLFTGAYKIKVSEQGINITNATIEGDLGLENVEINYPVYLKHCIFKGKVNFKRSYFKKDLSFEGSKFLKSANFRGIKTDGYFSCDGARFEDECFWNDAKIGLEFQARRAEFCSKEATVDFNSLKAGDSIRFESAEFHGPVIFIRVATGRQFIAHESKFFNPDKLVNFGGIITSNTIYLVKAEFHGPVKFRLAEIGMNFNATGAKFLNEKQPKDFSYMKVAQKAMFGETFLRGDFDFSYSDFYDLEIRGAQKDEKAGREKDVFIAYLNLKGSQVQRNLDLVNVSAAKLNANQMKVKGAASIENAQINKLADFRGGNFQSLDFQKVKWPLVDQQKPAKGEKKRFRYEVYLGDLTFGSLSMDKPECDADANPYESDYKDADFKRIIGFVDDCPFYTQSYVQVETFFKRIGRESWANEVFMDMNDRELAEKMQWYDPVRWVQWFFWGKIAGYGRAPFRVFFLSLAFIIIGACLFDPRFLTVNKISAEGRIRDAAIRLIISLDRFLPIELGLAKDWNAEGRRFHVWLYFFLQQVLGWILIPIALASIYSQLK